MLGFVANRQGSKVHSMKKAYEQAKPSSIKGSRVAVVQAAWHKEHSDNMVKATREILNSADCEAVDVYLVPGTYEIPLTAKKLARTAKYDAIIVYGIIVKGDTDHYEVLVQTVIRELGKVMYDFEVPIIMEILPVHKLEDAITRTVGEHNKGIEAARATIDVITLYRHMATVIAN